MRSLRTVHINVFAVATLAALAHIADEVRIGEFIALPFAAANVAVALVCPRPGRVCEMILRVSAGQALESGWT
ncbi:hypothetical protein [Ornithinimicrobium murale]|uniref:hypothetical protein n=1 Tax=Ornithinimicrobium murale TaxID=1050153 RepID=UPI000E0CD26F|nr:hypothetical protein [Ornithinimicrobium murale]